MEKNPILDSPAAATLPPPTSRNVDPSLIKARIAILAILQAHEAEAEKYIQQLQVVESYNINAGLASMMTYYGFELWQHDKLDLAHRIYTKAAELHSDPTTLLNLAISYKEHTKDSKKFLELVQKVEGKSDQPEDLKQLNRAFNQLKNYYLEQKNFKMALQYMQKIDAIVPNDNVNICDMAIIQRQNGKYKESAALLERVLQIRPTNKKFLMELAITKALLGNKQEARDLAAKSGREKTIWLFVGEHYLKNRDKRKAADAFMEGLNLFPEDSELLEKIKIAK